MKNNMKLAAIISYVTIIVSNLISILYTPFLLVTLGQSEYGLFSLVNSIVAYIYLLDMGFGNAVIRYNSKYTAEKKYDSLKKVNGMFLALYIILGMAALIIGIIAYFNMGSIFGRGLSNEEITKTKLMFLIAVINVALSFPLSIFNSIIISNERFVFIKSVNLIRSVLNPIIMILVLLVGYKALGMIIASTIFNLFMGLVNIRYCCKNLKLKIKFEGFDKELFKQIIKYSFFVFLSSIAYLIYWNTDQFLLAMFIGSAPIAVYALGSQFNNYFVSLSNVLSGMFLPKLTKMVALKPDNSELMEVLVKVGRIQFFICTFIFGGFFLVGKQFIARWVGLDYSEAYIFAIIFMVPQIFSIIQALFATMLEAMNMHRVKAYIYLSVALVNLILSIILVKKYQGLGCAIGTATGMMINAIANNIYYKYKIKLDINYFWKEIIKLLVPLVITLILGVIIVSNFNLITYYQIALFVIAFSIIYFCVFWIIGFNKYEKSIIASILQKHKDTTI